MGGRTRAQTCTRPDALSIATAERRAQDRWTVWKNFKMHWIWFCWLVSLQPGLRSSLKQSCIVLQISPNLKLAYNVKMASAAESSMTWAGHEVCSVCARCRHFSSVLTEVGLTFKQFRALPGLICSFSNLLKPHPLRIHSFSNHRRWARVAAASQPLWRLLPHNEKKANKRTVIIIFPYIFPNKKYWNSHLVVFATVFPISDTVLSSS